MKLLLPLLFILFFLPLALADNLTNSTGLDYNPAQTNDILQQFSEQSKNFVSQIKTIVPYELWFFSTIALFVLLIFVRGGNQAYGGMWKLGLYFSLIVVVLWFLLSR